jgi:hypothetical protein
MKSAGCNDEFRFTDRAGLVEKSKKIEWGACAGGLVTTTKTDLPLPHTSHVQ